MTMLVLINHKDNLILAADKRVVWKSTTGEILQVLSDDVGKITKWPGGFISGCGFAPLLEEVKEFASGDDVGSIHEISHFLRSKVTSSSLDEYWISTTKFVAIYESNMGYRAVFFDANQDGVRAINDNSCLIIVNGVDTSFYKNRIELLLSVNDLSISDITTVLSDLFSDVSSRNQGVSSGYDMAIINNDGRVVRKFNS